MAERLAPRVRWLLPVLAGTTLLAGAFSLPLQEAQAAPGPNSGCTLEDAMAGRTGPDNCQQYLKNRTAEIAAAKIAAANAYDAYLRGRGTAQQIAVAELRLSALTGERIPTPVPYQVPTTNGRSNTAGPQPPLSRIQSQFQVFRQVNDIYCGPAAAMSILLFLGATESATYDRTRDENPVLIGDPERDQGILANSFWLATNQYSGTNWGQPYMPFTLNAWRGTDWYVQSGTPKVEGTLTREQAWRNIQYSIDRGYPIAVNVRYGPGTFTLAGFNPAITYRHWDIISGYYTDSEGKRFVRVSEVYGDPDYGYEPHQDVPWEEYWLTIGRWHGMVW